MIKKTRDNFSLIAIVAGLMMPVSCVAQTAAPRAATSQVSGPRQMENLGRGVVAVRANQREVFVSWRLLGLEPNGLQFNLYRATSGGAPVKLNAAPLDKGTNFTDKTADLAQSNAYFVRPVANGAEGAASAAYTLAANAPPEQIIRIPLRAPYDRAVHHCWVGDVDGDGEYEFIVSLLATTEGQTQKVAAYKRDGTFLWEADMGPNSVDTSGLYPGSSSIAAGQWDGATVYDLDGDGRAEVILKSANGVKFGDGATLSHGDEVTQFISVLDGQTGREKARAELPNPFKSQRNRSLAALLGVGYLDGVRPSLVIHAKNRVGGGGTPFNMINSAWDYRDGKLSQRWSLQWKGDAPDLPVTSHQMRIMDVNGDGKDDVLPGMHAIGSDGKLLYNLGTQGVIHGDRFHISDLNPTRPGLEGYGIQQDNESGLAEYFYDAATGKILWENNIGKTVDAARGVAADLDPRTPGFEVWSFYGIRSAKGEKIADEPNRPYPNFQIWWDGDLLGETLHRTLVEKWNPATQKTARLLTAYRLGAKEGARDAPAFYGDILGDWREEIIFEKSDHSELQIFTTTAPTDVRLYTLAHNPAYRNQMTVKGYMQENLPDYFLGDGMKTPPNPNIVYVKP